MTVHSNTEWVLRIPGVTNPAESPLGIVKGRPLVYRHLRANFKYDVIPIALFQAPIYVTSGNEALM